MMRAASRRHGRGACSATSQRTCENTAWSCLLSFVRIQRGLHPRVPPNCVLLVTRCYHQRCYWWQRVVSSIECAIADSQCVQKPQTSTNTWQEHSHLKVHVKLKSFAWLLDAGSRLESGTNLKSTNPINLRSRGVLASTCRQVWILFTRV